MVVAAQRIGLEGGEHRSDDLPHQVRQVRGSRARVLGRGRDPATPILVSDQPRSHGCSPSIGSLIERAHDPAEHCPRGGSGSLARLLVTVQRVATIGRASVRAA